MPDWHKFKHLIDGHQRFVLSCHVRPDADALGSELAMAELLRELGKEVRIINPSSAPSTLDFLIADDDVGVLGAVKAEDALDTDVHMILDTSAWSQLQGIGDVLKRTAALKIVIDHHASSDDLGGVDFKDTSAEATGSMVYRFARATGLPINERAATCLFCAIATDTGWFRFPSVTSQTYRDISELIDLGVRPHLLYQSLYDRYTLPRFHLAGRVLQRMTVVADGRLSYTWVDRNDFKETSSRPIDTEDLVNECLKVEGTRAAFIAVEQPNGQIKFSFRSREGFNVAAIAEQFGGGGHKQAAGALVAGPLEEAREKVLAAVLAAFELPA